MQTAKAAQHIKITKYLSVSLDVYDHLTLVWFQIAIRCNSLVSLVSLTDTTRHIGTDTQTHT